MGSQKLPEKLLTPNLTDFYAWATRDFVSAISAITFSTFIWMNPMMNSQQRQTVQTDMNSTMISRQLHSLILSDLVSATESFFQSVSSDYLPGTLWVGKQPSAGYLLMGSNVWVLA